MDEPRAAGLVGSLEMPVGSGWWVLLVTWESVRVLQPSLRAFVKVLALLGMKAIDMWFVRRMLKLSSELFSMATLLLILMAL